MEKYASVVRLIRVVVLLVSFCLIFDEFCEAGAPFRYGVKYHGHRIPFRYPNLYLTHPIRLNVRPFLKLVDPTTPIHYTHHHPHPRGPFNPFGKLPLGHRRPHPFHRGPHGPHTSHPYPHPADLPISPAFGSNGLNPYGHPNLPLDYVDEIDASYPGGPEAGYSPGIGPISDPDSTPLPVIEGTVVPEVPKAVVPVVDKSPTPISYIENIKTPGDIYNYNLHVHQNSQKIPISYADIKNIPAPVDIYNTPVVKDLYNPEPLVEKLPGALGLYGYPNAKKEILPVERIIRNVKLNEFVCVKKEEGTFAKQLVLSATTKSTFYFDPLLGDPKTIQVANTHEKLCLHGIPKDGRRATALGCNNEDPLLKWDMVPIHYGQFWIQQKGTNYCLQPSTTLTHPLFVEMKACDLYESLQLWDIGEAYPKDASLYGAY